MRSASEGLTGRGAQTFDSRFTPVVRSRGIARLKTEGRDARFGVRKLVFEGSDWMRFRARGGRGGDQEVLSGLF